MIVWNFDQDIINNKLTVIYGFNNDILIIVSDTPVIEMKHNDVINLGIQSFKVIDKCDDTPIPHLDSTINRSKCLYAYKVEVSLL